MKKTEPVTIYKLIVVGNCNVGKTNILSRYTQNQYNPDLANTVGIEYSSRTINLHNKSIRLDIWDTAGQQKYRCMAKVFYKDSLGAMVVFGLDDRNSFQDIPKWIHQIKQHALDNAKLIIVGNKCDLTERQVSKQQAQQFAQTNNSTYMEVSACEGTNISEAFQSLILEIYYDDNREVDSNKKSLFKPADLDGLKKKKDCC